MPMNRNRIIPGIIKLLKGVPCRMFVFNFISAPSGDEKSIAPLINPPAPIKINNSRKIHKEKGAAFFDLSNIFPLASFVPEMPPRKQLLINHVLIKTAVKRFSAPPEKYFVRLSRIVPPRHYQRKHVWE
jgi:hypothetical protein